MWSQHVVMVLAFYILIFCACRITEAPSPIIPKNESIKELMFPNKSAIVETGNGTNSERIPKIRLSSPRTAKAEYTRYPDGYNPECRYMKGCGAHPVRAFKHELRAEVEVDRPTKRLNCWVEDMHGVKLTSVHSYDTPNIGITIIDMSLYGISPGKYILACSATSERGVHGAVQTEFRLTD